jgi:carotenoid cleavage dioxygenase-like enzyme
MRTYGDDTAVDPVDRPTWVDDVDNPYLHGPYTPVESEITAVDPQVASGEIPHDLFGAYMRNGPNPVFRPKGLYHWFDGDGMVHAVYFRDGRASYFRDCGYVITLATHAKDYSAEAWIFDARRITAGPIARVTLSGRVPVGFHATWIPGRLLWPNGAARV